MQLPNNEKRAGTARRNALLAGLLVLAVLLAASCDRQERGFKSHFSKGLDSFGQQKYDVAFLQFRNAEALKPKAWAAHYWSALSALKLSRWPDAYKELNAVIDLQPSFSAARLDMADLLLLGGNTGGARGQVEAVLAQNPKNPRAQATLAKTYLLAKDYQKAVEECDKAQQLAPQSPGVWSSCAIAEVGLKQYEAAEKDFRRAIELDPHAASLYKNLANLLQLMGRADQVEPLFENGLKLNPRSLELHLDLADFYFWRRDAKSLEGLFAQMKSRAGDFPQLYANLGDFWMTRGEVAAATGEYEAAVKQDNSPLLQKKLIGAYITAGRYDEAEKLNRQLLAKNEKDHQAKFFHAALRQRGDPEGAVPELRAVLKEEPKSAPASYYLGLALMRTGKVDEAEGAFTDCIHNDPKFVQGFQRLAEIRLQHKDWDAAIDYGKRVVALMPRRPDGYLLVAEALINKGETERAKKILQFVDKAAPKFADTEELLAAAYIKEGKVEAGIKAYEQAWTHSADPVPRMNRFVDLMVARGDSKAAATTLIQFIAAKPEASSYEVLSRLYLITGDLVAAQAASQEALRLDSSRWLPHLHLAQVYLRLHRQEQALPELAEVMQRQPKFIPAYVLAGDVFVRQGKFDQAKSHFEAAQKQDPDSPVPRNGLARLWAEEGTHLDEAMAMVQGLQQKDPDNPILSDTLGFIYYRKGMYSQAVPLLKRCVEQQPGNAWFHLDLGMTYAKLGSRKLARQELESALKLGLDSARWETTARQVLSGQSPASG